MTGKVGKVAKFQKNLNHNSQRMRERMIEKTEKKSVADPVEEALNGGASKEPWTPPAPPAAAKKVEDVVFWILWGYVIL